MKTILIAVAVAVVIFMIAFHGITLLFDIIHGIVRLFINAFILLLNLGRWAIPLILVIVFVPKLFNLF